MSILSNIIYNEENTEYKIIILKNNLIKLFHYNKENIIIIYHRLIKKNSSKYLTIKHRSIIIYTT